MKYYADKGKKDFNMAARVNDRHVCPCCGQYMFEEYNSFDICDVCGWMDDALYEKDASYKGGGSKMNLNEAREAFKNGIQVR